MSADTYHVRCMYSAEADGGMAVVHRLDETTGNVIEAAEAWFAQQVSPDCVQVFVARTDNFDQHLYICESFSPDGSRIRFCGHGALAAGFVLAEQATQGEETYRFANADRDWLCQPSATEPGVMVLTYKRPSIADCPVPSFAAAALGNEPIAAAETGSTSDYLLIQLADADAVRHLQPDFTAISAATERALIVTAAADDNSHCVFRYFAPQYGTNEDRATGSAAVQLAGWWAPRLGMDSFAAHQLSPGGARMQLSCNADTVELIARVGYA